jgi:hypothetical protein
MRSELGASGHCSSQTSNPRQLIKKWPTQNSIKYT